jgi:hypothetical protein
MIKPEIFFDGSAGQQHTPGYFFLQGSSWKAPPRFQSTYVQWPLR